MKLSKYIKGLQEILKKDGDLECYYASDPEGNSYNRVTYNGGIFYIDELYHRIDCVYSEEDLEEYGPDNLIKICVVN